MYKLLAICAVIGASVASALASTMVGSFTWVSGTLTASVTPSTAPITISLHTSSGTVSLPSTLVIGAITTAIPAGTPMEVLKSGSTPWSAIYTASSLIAYDFEGDIPGRRVVPMSSAGAISDNVAFVSTGGPTSINLIIPANTVGTYSFPNGLLETIGSPIAHFSVNLPAAGASTTGAVYFPSTLPVPDNFVFNAAGINNLSIQGRSASYVCTVAGFLTSNGGSTSTTFTGAQLSVSNGYAF